MQCLTPPVGICGPRSARAVSHTVHHATARIHEDEVLRVIAETTTELLTPYDNVGEGKDLCWTVEAEFDPTDAPTAEINRRGTGIEQFDVVLVVPAGNVVIVDLADDDRSSRFVAP